MCPADKEVFSSFAHAQVSITNEIYQYLGEPETFLFCPTGSPVLCLNHLHILHNSFIYLCIYYLFVLSPWYPEYCGTFCYPNVPQSPYLHTVGEKLLPGIDVLWTGESNLSPLVLLGIQSYISEQLCTQILFLFLQAPRWCPKISQWSLLRRCQKS